MKCFRRI